MGILLRETIEKRPERDLKERPDHPLSSYRQAPLQWLYDSLPLKGGSKMSSRVRGGFLKRGVGARRGQPAQVVGDPAPGFDEGREIDPGLNTEAAEHVEHIL